MASATDIDRVLAAARRARPRKKKETGMTQVGPDKKAAFENPGRLPPLMSASAGPSGLSSAGGQAMANTAAPGNPQKLTNEAAYRRIIRQRMGVTDVRTATPEQLKRIRDWLPKRAGQTRRGAERTGRR